VRKDGTPSSGIVADPAPPEGKRGAERQVGFAKGIIVRKTPGQLNRPLGRQ